VHAAPDPYAILGVARGATDTAIHAGYRAAVRHTHPDAGGSAAEFEAVQEAYELLRDPRRRRAWDAGHPGPRASAAAGGASRTSPNARTAPDARAAQRAMDDLLAESQRLEDEARDLAGRTRRRRPGSAGDDEEQPEDSMSAVLRDAGRQLSTVAADWSRELSRILRRMG
jgi:curved DNA-binding protein CbpA